MGPDLVKDIINAFSKVKGEIDKEGGEFDFRYSLLRHLFEGVLRWGRREGEGHFAVERERKDVLLYDDSSPCRCVGVVETKGPSVKLEEKHKAQLEEYMAEIGTAQYGVLTNGHRFILFEYTSEGKLNELVFIDIDAFVHKGAEALTKAERQKVHLLRRLKNDRFVGASDADYFRSTAQKIRVEDPEKFGIFIGNLRAALKDLTDIIEERFFKFYWGASPNHYGGKFLRDEAFQRWKGTSAGNEEELSEKFCKETAYVILNRILFTRILEDKGIVKRRISGNEFAQLRTMLGPAVYKTVVKQAYDEVKKFYEHFYEFGIFDWWRLTEEKWGMLTEEEKRVQKEIEDEFNAGVIRDVLKKLNQFDFRNVDRDLLGDVYQEYLPAEERKRLGEFYTPIEVVKYILDAVGYTPENEIESKFLLDPACGSGTFLVEAATRLAGRYEKKGLYPRNPDDCKTIVGGIVNNIHGLDINPFACHIAEMNLLFNILDYLHAAHRKYRDYRLPRFNICCTDSLMPPEVEVPITEYIINGRLRSHLEESKRATQVKTKQFDFVVGNPPYVRKELIPSKYKKRVLERGHLEVYHGDNDLSVYFIEEGLKLLKKNGMISFITTNKFAKSRYGEKIRDYILSNSKIKQFIDFGDVRVFADAVNYPTIFVFEKGKKENQLNICKIVVVSKKMGADKDILDHIIDKIKLERYSDEYIDLFQLRQRNLDKSYWKLLSERNISVLNKIKIGSSQLKNICKVDRGVQTGFNEAFMIDTETLQQKNFERTLIKPLLKGEDVRKYRITHTNLFLIYPYQVNISDYPNIKKHLERYRNKLEKRWCVTDPRMGRKWYELEKPKRPTLFENEKILLPNMAQKNSFTYDNKGYYCLHSVYILTILKKSKLNLKFLLGLLNSPPVEFFFKQISTFVRDKWYMYHKHYLERLPIKLPQTKEEQKLPEKISRHVEQLLRINEQLGKLREKIEKFPDLYPGNKKTKDLVERAVHIPSPKDVYKIKSPTIEALSEKGPYRVWINKQDYIDFDHPQIAEYVRQCLLKKDKIRRGEMLKLKIPTDEDLEKIMHEFIEDQRKVGEIKKEVQNLEKEIDELVYALYGLNDEDKKVIEKFLERF